MKKRWVVVLELQKLSDTLKIEKAREIVTAMTGNAHFPGPYPTLANLSTQANTTETAYLNSRGGEHAAVAVFHTALDQLERMMLTEADYVKVIANDNPDIGGDIIISAGMHFKSESPHNGQEFSVKNTRVKGEVSARTKSAGASATYIWQFRLQGERAWVSAKSTSKAKYTYSGLTSASTYEFRVGVSVKSGPEVFSDPAELVVV